MNRSKDLASTTQLQRRSESAPAAVVEKRHRVFTLFSHFHKRGHSHSDCELRLDLNRVTNSSGSSSSPNSSPVTPTEFGSTPTSPKSPTSPTSPGARGFLGFLEPDVDSSLQDETAIALKNILQDKKGRELLRQFLKKEFAEENLLFYEAVENYSLLPEWDAPPAAVLIFKTFIAEDAQHEINLPESIIEKIRQLFDQSGRIYNSYRRIHKEIFEQARTAVFRMMLNDTMSRFCNSREYKEFCARD